MKDNLKFLEFKTKAKTLIIELYPSVNKKSFMQLVDGLGTVPGPSFLIPIDIGMNYSKLYNPQLPLLVV